MISGHDFTGHHVWVVGGTRGEGHAIAAAFADAGATVTVTGTMMLRELYEADLTPFHYEMVNLARQPSIDRLVDSVQQIDVLVLAATCNLPHGLPASERAFVAEAARSGLLGPSFLTTRLRLKLSQSPVLGGGCVVNTGAVRTWLELSSSTEDAAAGLVEATRRAGDNGAGLGIRVNGVMHAGRGFLPRQYAPAAGDTLVRTQRQGTQEAVTQAVLFLASGSASRITGQTLRLS